MIEQTFTIHILDLRADAVVLVIFVCLTVYDDDDDDDRYCVSVVCCSRCGFSQLARSKQFRYLNESGRAAGRGLLIRSRYRRRFSVTRVPRDDVYKLQSRGWTYGHHADSVQRRVRTLRFTDSIRSSLKTSRDPQGTWTSHSG